MSGTVQDELHEALALTIEMCAAAGDGNWTLVAELDKKRQLHLQRMQSESLGMQQHEALAALQTQNNALLERAREVHAVVEEQLSQHQYKHRALRSYVTSSF
ncbi:hypothetical protein [Dyella choica]|uniref:Flagellar protein FliT n=1 Tax=Dyella choica TaxID=1927959 RepID=A0A432M737_9GAMM|nr:hypothetical protein [Dyella choica]RUL76142.1 hypothetical protein EKH80_10570 [Dyella choica]